MFIKIIKISSRYFILQKLESIKEEHKTVRDESLRLKEELEKSKLSEVTSVD